MPFRSMSPYTVDVTPESALVAWGGFFLEERNGGWLVVDDDELAARRKGGTIGAGSAPYGQAVVEVLDPDGRVVATASTDERNHVEVTGLRIQDIDMPEDLKRMMSRQASAEREKRANITKAEGDHKVAVQKCEAQGGDAQQACKEQADAALEVAKADAKAAYPQR